ncbi:hypothetical protein FRB90_008045, partial [Tulasnella sp. 427]
MVKGVALKEGKVRDLKWTAAFASSLFFGNALRWLEGLDEGIQHDWNLMRRAILQRWAIEDPGI